MPSSSLSTVFRVTGLPLGQALLDIQKVRNLLNEDEQKNITISVTCIPSCDDNGTSSALVEFKGGNPEFLSPLDQEPLSDWQVEMGGEDINFDRHFFGFTQLYSTAPGQPITADIIAITGLDRHAYGSWRGRGPLKRMWLRDFLSRDLPSCRTMIYGYDSKLSSRGVGTIMDYGRELLEGIKRLRYTQELRERPLFFIAHSFGGIIVAHCLIKAVQADERDHETIAALHKATYGILFFGTPHKGLVIDDIQRMIASEDHHPRADLLEQIKVNSELLKHQLADFKNLIRDRRIVSFYETHQTRQLELSSERGAWGRTGPYITAVHADSALLDLPDNIEAKIPVNADHSYIVKFDTRNVETYKAALYHLKQFERDARRVVSDRFLPSTRKKAPISTVPFIRDKSFVGRHDILKDLESRFTEIDSHNRVVLIGLGGVGKSQIAIEYSYLLRAKDPQIWIFWIYAATAERFEQGYKSIAVTLELPGFDDPKTDALGLVLRWLNDVDKGRWLIILDNADDKDALCQRQVERSQDSNSTQITVPLSSYIPQTANGSVLVTTRDLRAASWLSTGYNSAITVNMMTPGDAELLLRSNIPNGISTALERAELVKELDYLPLAITQAAAYITFSERRTNVSRYLTLYKQDERSQSRLLDEEFGDLRRDASVYNSVTRTWQISFDQIKQIRPKASELMSFMAMFDRQGIPESLLAVEYPDPLDLDCSIAILSQFSLIKVEKGGQSFQIHRLVQLATRWSLKKNENFEKWQEQAMKALSETFPTGDYTNWKTCAALSPHAREVLRYSLESQEQLLRRASLLHNMAWYSWHQGCYSIALEECQESLTIRKQHVTNVDQEIWNSTEMLALILQYQGKYSESETMNRQAIEGFQTTLGPEHPDTLISMSNLASVLLYQGKYSESETMNRRAVEGFQTVLGPEHPDTLTSMSNLASVLRYQGKYSESETMDRQVLAVLEAALGPEHPDTLTSMSRLASVLQNQGKYSESETMNRQVLAVQEAVLGPEHPNTLISINNLASVLRNQGKYNESETMNRQVLAVREAVLGPKHPDTLLSVYHLAYLLEILARYDEASILYNRACNGFENTLGLEHSTTRTCLDHRATLIEKMELQNID